MICFTEVRFLQTYSPLRWSQRPGLFQPFPSHKQSLRPSELLFSINWDRIEEEEKRSKRKSSKEHNKTLSSSHYCFEWNWDLKRF
jgi:hypothetical protein